MSIIKVYLKTKPICKVTFSIPKENHPGARTINVVGEFNNWSPKATPMIAYKNGSFAATIDLSVNNQYQFRYLLDGIDWKNDWEADNYVHCPYGNCHNSVVAI